MILPLKNVDQCFNMYYFGYEDSPKNDDMGLSSFRWVSMKSIINLPELLAPRTLGKPAIYEEKRTFFQRRQVQTEKVIPSRNSRLQIK